MQLPRTASDVVTCFDADWIRALAVSPDNTRLLSGCVAAVVCGWDLPCQRVLFRVGAAADVEAASASVAAAGASLNTVNSLEFQPTSATACVSAEQAEEEEMVVGGGDGGGANVFACGTRDGWLSLYDWRHPLRPVQRGACGARWFRLVEVCVCSSHVVGSQCVLMRRS